MWKPASFIFIGIFAQIIGAIGHNLNAAPRDQFNTSLEYALFEHKNNGYSTEEKGNLNGLSFSISHKKKRMRGVVSLALYAGDVDFSAVSSEKPVETSTEEKLAQLSYQLESNHLQRFYQPYINISFQRWHRNIAGNEDFSGVERKYEWWNIETGIQASLYKSHKNHIRINGGLSHTFFNRLLIDLKSQNLGKPLLEPKAKVGFAGGIVANHKFNPVHGIELSANAKYWQFGDASRLVNRGGQITEVNEPESKTTLLSLQLTYFRLF